MANSVIGSVTIHGDGNSFILDNNARKEASLTPLPFYLLDSDQTDVFDFGGAMKTFTLSGLYIGASIAACETFIKNIEGLIQGAQDVSAGYPLDFTDDYRNPDNVAIKVKISDVETTNVAGAPLIVRWTIKLIQSSSNA